MGCAASHSLPHPPCRGGGSSEACAAHAHAPARPRFRAFSYDELYAATAGFAAHRTLGEGGFGRVVTGELLGGERVAVKLLDRGGLQGDAEFEAEAVALARLAHPHVVRLLGVCVDGPARAAVLVLAPGGSVRCALDEGRLPWVARVRLAVGLARALAYIHDVRESGVGGGEWGMG